MDLYSLSISVPNLHTCSKKELTSFFESSYDLEDVLFASIIDKKYFYCVPNKLRLPLIFYYGHSPAFYINKMMLAGMIKERVNFSLETLFETGVDEMSWDDVENYRLGGAFDWPTVEQVHEYRNQVKTIVKNAIESYPLDLPITQLSPWWSFVMTVQHQRIHIETTSVLLRQLPVNYLSKPVGWVYASCSNDSTGSKLINNFVQISSGTVSLGIPVDSSSYAWDLDYGKLEINVPSFEATKYKITNAEFLKFVNDGGYCREDLWTPEGWVWLKSWNVAHPIFWVCSKGCPSLCGGDLKSYSHCNIAENSTHFMYRAMFDVIDMPWDWPVEVNFHEARAFCEWKGNNCRLITEAEHFLLIRQNQTEMTGNTNCSYGSATPVNLLPPNDVGIYDACGNVWEWTADHINGLPGYQTNYLYEDYSWPFFDGQHMMMLGASWITTGYSAMPYTRNFFRPHFYQNSGFRMVRSLTSDPIPVKYIKSSNEGILKNTPHTSFQSSMSSHHIYEDPEILKTYNVKKATNAQELLSVCCDMFEKFNINMNNCLVVCCGLGLLSFQLATVFQEVTGIDYSSTLISGAEDLLNNGCITLSNGETLCLPSQLQKEKVRFKQLTCLYNEFKGYNVVIFEEMERLIEPKGWLLKVRECVVENGLVIVIMHPNEKQCLENTLSPWFNELTEVYNSKEFLVSVWQRCN